MATHRRLWTTIALTAAIVLPAAVFALRIGGESSETPFRSINSSFDVIASTPTELRSLSDAVVRARPLDTKEILLVSGPIGEDPEAQATAFVWAREFEVVETFTGDLEVGQVIAVTRYEATFDDGSSAVSDLQPAFSAKSYIFGLDRHDKAYKMPVWVPVGGPSGAVPMTTEKVGGVAMVEVEGVALQTFLSGASADQISTAFSEDAK